MKAKKGFTLVELLATIVILGILLTIAVTSYSKVVANFKKEALEKKVEMLKNNAISQNIIDEKKIGYYELKDLVEKDSELASPYGGQLSGFIIVDSTGDNREIIPCINSGNLENNNVGYHNYAMSCNQNLTQNDEYDATEAIVAQAFREKYGYTQIQMEHGDAGVYADSYYILDKDNNITKLEGNKRLILNSDVYYKYNASEYIKSLVLANDGTYATLLIDEEEFLSKFYPEKQDASYPFYYNDFQTVKDKIKNQMKNENLGIRILDIDDLNARHYTDKSYYNIGNEFSNRDFKNSTGKSSNILIVSVDSGYDRFSPIIKKTINKTNWYRYWIADNIVCGNDGKIEANERDKPYTYCIYVEKLSAAGQYRFNKSTVYKNESNYTSLGPSSARFPIVLEVYDYENIFKEIPSLSNMS